MSAHLRQDALPLRAAAVRHPQPFPERNRPQLPDRRARQQAGQRASGLQAVKRAGLWTVRKAGLWTVKANAYQKAYVVVNNTDLNVGTFAYCGVNTPSLGFAGRKKCRFKQAVLFLLILFLLILFFLV